MSMNMFENFKDGMILVARHTMKKTDEIVDEAQELKIIESNKQYIVVFEGYVIYVAEEYNEAYNHFMMLLKTLALNTLPEPVQRTLHTLNYPSFRIKVTEKNEVVVMIENRL